MAASGVNLDALIEREDLQVTSSPLGGNPTGEVNIALLTQDIFISGLRKPDFQRETVNWSPQKIVDLVTAFLDGDLIPAVILWRSGHYTFVIDGAHRLSAILAWLNDDYGDKSKSIAFFNNLIPREQKDLAEKTRALVDSTIGSHAALKDKSKNRDFLDDITKKRLGNYSTNSFVVQWVPHSDADGAEASFFKINQLPTPVDPIEKQILKGRLLPNAIASRAINRNGVGHKYWGHFSLEIQHQIEKLGREVYTALYSPPMEAESVKTSDVPVGGRGYSALPFIYDVVNIVNGIGKKGVVQRDQDGSTTLQHLAAVRKKLSRITTNDPGSLGLHPLVYFYTRGGAFQPVAFLASVQVFNRLIDKGNASRFCDIRKDFESFLMKHKEAFTLVVKALGSGPRSRPALEAFLEMTMEELWQGKAEAEIVSVLAADNRFRFLSTPQPIRAQTRRSKGFDSSAKSAAYILTLFDSGVRCSECGGLVHSNSMTVDHAVRLADGGGNNSRNARITHPYCNSGYKEQRAHNPQQSPG